MREEIKALAEVVKAMIEAISATGHRSSSQ